MPEGSVERRLDRIESRQDQMVETLAVIREKVEQTNGHVDDVLAEIGRVPPMEARAGRLPITDRLHSIEAVVTPVAMQAAVHTALDQRRGLTWTRAQKGVTIGGVVVGTVFTVLRFAGLGG